MPDYTKSAFSNWLFSQPEFHRLYDLWVASGYLKMEKPSCDRKDDYAPYAFDNLQIITWQENDEKGKSDRKNGINNKHSKAVIQFDLSGNLITKHYSGRYAERVTGINSANISACCLGKVKSAGGFKWSHA